MLKCLAASLCLFWAHLSLPAQEVMLFGHVQDTQTGEPLISATVQAGERGVLTDRDGRFALALAPGSYQLLVRFIGYVPLERSLDVPQKDSLDVGILTMTVETSLLREITITTGKFEKPLGETTVSLEVLKPSLVEQVNTTSIDDVLDKVAGVSIIDGQANIRGGSGFSYGAGSRVLLLVDDIPALQVDAGFPSWDDFPVENIAQMEIVKGASSALYGSSALNGIINVRTAYATDNPVTKASLFYGSYMSPQDKAKQWWSTAPREFGLSLNDRRRVGKFDLVHSFYYMDRKSFQREWYDQYGRLTSKVRYRPSLGMEVGAHVSINRGIDQDFFFWMDHEARAYQGDSSNYSTGDYLRYYIDPYIKILGKKGDRHEFKGRFFDVDNENNANRSNQSTLYYGEYQYLNRLPSWDAVATFGLVGIHTLVNAELYGDTTFTSNNFAGYFQLEKKFFNRLTANAGIRYERNTVIGPSRVGNDLIPGGKASESKPVFRLGLNYQLHRATYLRASWGQGYRYPTIAEKFISTSFGPTLVSPNPGLQSETGWSGEVGVKQGFEVDGFQGFADLALYWSEYQDMMEFVFTGLIEGFQSQNVGDTRIRGLDFSVNGGGQVLGLESALTAGYTYIDPRFQDFTERDSLASSVDYNILKYRSKHLIKFDFQTGGKKLKAGISLQRNSHMEAVDAIFELFVPGLQEFRRTHRGYTVTDLRLTYQLSDQLRCTALLKNALNNEYSVRPGLLAAPRNVTLRLDLEL